MVFSSIPFLYYYLPCVLVLYFLVPERWHNHVLLAASLFFYAWGEPLYVWLMLFMIILGYAAGILIQKSRDGKYRFLKPETVLLAAVMIYAGIFIYFKYTDFLIDSFNAVTKLSVPLLHIVLPVGISFYIFQIISYLTDVFRGKVPAQKNIIALATYIAMFPQLIAGPIVRYRTVAEQIQERKTTLLMVQSGIYRFVIGLSKKVLLANELGAFCDVFRQSTDKSVLYYWMYALALTQYIYFDFSGYSDMAIGLGRILGFSFPENFNYPYISGSITEFFRRWHISLGSWFRDYLYIPLGGNRVSEMKWYRNILIVWLFTGLWHGAAWNFAIWGLYFGVLLIIEKKWLSGILQKAGVIGHIYVLFLVVVGFVIFNAADMAQAADDLKCMFGMGSILPVSKEAWYYLGSYGVTMLIGLVGCTPLATCMISKIPPQADNIRFVIQTVGIIGLLLLSTAYLVDGSFNPFLYFRF